MNADRPIDSIPVEELLEAFERVRGALDEIQSEHCDPVRVDPTEVTARGIQVAENAWRDRTEFEEMYRHPPLDEIDWLRTKALAVKGAELSAVEHGHENRAGDDHEYIRRALFALEEAYSTVRDYAFVLYRKNPDKWREDYPPLHSRSNATRLSRRTSHEDDDLDGTTTPVPALSAEPRGGH